MEWNTWLCYVFQLCACLNRHFSMLLCNLPMQVCGCYSIHPSLACIQTSEGDNSRQQHSCVCVKWVFHGWQGFLFRGGVSAARFQIELGVCAHTALIWEPGGHTKCYTSYSALHSLEINKIFSFCEAMYRDSCSDCSQITLPRVPIFPFFTGFASRVLLLCSWNTSRATHLSPGASHHV